MYSIVSDKITPELLYKFRNEEFLRAGDVIELYLFFKQMSLSAKKLGEHYGIATVALEAELKSITEQAEKRSLLGYCDEVLASLAAESEVNVDLGVAFVEIEGEKGSEEWKTAGKALKEQTLALPYVKDVNYVDQGKVNGFFASYSKAEVPEGEAFSQTVGSIAEAKKVHKVA